MRHGSLVLLLLLGVSATTIASDWRRIELRNDILIEARDVEGSPLHEVRATTHSEVPVLAILRTLWRHEDHPGFIPHLRHVEVVRDAGDERIVYEQIAIPVLRDRDVVVRARRTIDASGVADVTTSAIADEGPPETPSFVRVRTSAGHWHLAPAPGGGTDVTYTIRTDIGGNVPAWLVNTAQHDTVPELVRAVLTRARSVTTTGTQ